MNRSVLIAGVGFEFEIIEDKTGKVVDTLITDEDGYAHSIELPYGNYTIVEKEDDAYNTMEPIKVFISEDGKTYHYNIMNEIRKSALTIVKKDADTGNTIPVSGIGFKLEKEDGTYLTQTVLNQDTFYTDKDGKVILPEKLNYGETYTIKEVSGTVPEKYLLSFEGKEFTVNGEDMITISMYNKSVKGSITVKKEGEVLTGTSKDDNGNISFIYENRSVSNVSFTIIAAEDIKAEDMVSEDYYKSGDTVATITTDENGNATLSDLPLGKYKIYENTAGDGFVLNKEVKEVELTYEDQYTAVVFEEVGYINERQKVEVTVTKKDSEDGSLLSGATFGLYAIEDIYDYKSCTSVPQVNLPLVEEGTLIETATTDESGTVTFNANLPLNYKFVIKELDAPKGYASTDYEYEFTTEYDGQDKAVIKYEVVFENDITKVEVSKKDITNDEEIAGAKLIVYEDDTDTIIESWTSGDDGLNEDGTVKPHMIKGLEVGKTYHLKEIVAPYGYAIASEIEFTILDTGEIQKVEMKDEIAKGTISVHKVDSENEEKILAGVVFNISTHEDMSEPFMSLETDETGYAIFEELVVGVYYIQEAEQIDGYIVNDHIYKVEVTADGDMLEITCVNQPTEMKFSKVDLTIGKELPGATITVTDKETGEVIDKWVSTDEPHIIKYLVEGKEYVMTEEIAPDGYYKAESITFTAKNGEKITMEDRIVPHTGDETNISLWLSIAAASTVLILYLLLLKKEKNQRK